MPIRNIADNQANVSFTLDQFKSLLHYTDKKGFATGVDKTNGTFKLDGKGKLANVNRYRYAIKRAESNEVQSLQIRVALYNAFSDKTADASFLKTVRTTLGLNEELNPDADNVVDGHVLGNTPLARRDVKSLLLKFKKVQEGELEASGETFKKNLKESLSQLLINSERWEFMQNSVKLLTGVVADALDVSVAQFVEKMNKGGRVSLEGLTKLALYIYNRIYAPNTLIAILDEGDRENWKSVIGAALIKFADEFGYKDQLSEYLRNELHWNLGGQQDLQQDSDEEVQKGHAVKVEAKSNVPVRDVEGGVESFAENVKNGLKKLIGDLTDIEITPESTSLSNIRYGLEVDVKRFVEGVKGAPDKVVEKLKGFGSNCKKKIRKQFSDYSIKETDVTTWLKVIDDAVLRFDDQLGCREELSEAIKEEAL